MLPEHTIPAYDAFDDLLFEIAKGFLDRDPTIMQDPNLDFATLVKIDHEKIPPTP